MPAPLDFYFDFSSPYGYFCSTAIDALGARHGREVIWHPILLGVIFKSTGARALPTLPIKGPYALKDIARTARFHGIGYRQPTTLPIATVNAARAFYWAQEAHGVSRAKALAHALFKGYFVEDRNVGEVAVIAELAQGLDLDPQAMVEGLQAPSIKDRLRLETEDALARGVFGSPYVLVDGEPFWGFDRFDQIEAWLTHGKI